MRYSTALGKDRLYGIVVSATTGQLIVEWEDSVKCSISRNHVYKSGRYR